MVKQEHEIRDPIHTFIKVSQHERNLISQRPFQRLRYIHQLALTYLINPGATNTRFEHSLGVLELASRAFDVLTNPANLTDEVKDSIPEITDNRMLSNCRKHLRMAALCHDLGHTCFSHATENLLPEGKKHEDVTREILEHSKIRKIMEENGFYIDKILNLVERRAGTPHWDALLSEIITGDALGVDRMDYLLRDSYYTGNVCGRFDHFRLLDCMRILPTPPIPDDNQQEESCVGIDISGIHSAEAMMIARYFMYSQVYNHHVRRIYNIHLQEYMRAWLPDGMYPKDVDKLISLTDDRIIADMWEAAEDSTNPRCELARRIVYREHFRCLYKSNPADPEDCVAELFNRAKEKFGEQDVRFDTCRFKGGDMDFPILLDSKMPTKSSIAVSNTIGNLTPFQEQFVFIHPKHWPQAKKWRAKQLDDIIRKER